MEDLTKEEKFIHDFANLCNSCCIDKEAIFKAFCGEHRTLQQSMFGVILAIISGIAGKDYSIDGRNTASRKMAIQFIEGYAEMEYQKFLEEHKFNMHNDKDLAYYTGKAGELRKAIIENPALYLRLPCI